MTPAQVAEPLPECLEPYCGAPMTRETAERNGGYCTRHLPLHPEAWRAARDRARAAAHARALGAARARLARQQARR